jgi:hypothetical protein
MDDGIITTLKQIAVELVDDWDLAPSASPVTRLVALTKAMELEEQARVDVQVAGEPDAPDPTRDTTLRTAIMDDIFKGFIGVSASRVRAGKVADKVLDTLAEFYEAAERAAILGESGRTN